MKQMTKLENIIMHRTGCNRTTANLVANDIINEIEKDLGSEIVEEIERNCIDTFGNFNNEAFAELKKNHAND